jgi:hypothetical protein
MRRYLYVGAVAGGFLLLGAAPAYADVLPAPVGAQQVGGLLGSTGGLDPAGGLRISDPLGGAGSLLDVEPGDNSADVPGADGVIPPQSDVARTGLGSPGDRTTRRPSRPAQRPDTEDVPAVGGGLPLSNLPISNVLGGLPMLGGLLPNGSATGLSPADQESGLLSDGLPLLGGLLPAASAPAEPNASGLPAGGTDVPAAQQPARTKPAAAVKPAPDPAIANDARLHEEPTDPEGKAGKQRSFSDGRPVAGVDPDYK